jgi:hypothetical protein
MRRNILIFSFAFFVTSLLVLNSPALATESRLSGMGDLSIVIEDESNMINLWDFAGNPAGFLADEKGSVIRSDLFREAYDIRNLRCSYRPNSFYKCKADGDILTSSISMSVRRADEIALGTEAKYFFRETDFENSGVELEYPEVLFVLSKRLNSLTCMGADIGYVEYTSKYRYKETDSESSYKTKYFKMQLGVGRQVTPGVTLAAHLGYDNIDSKPYSVRSDFRDYWLSVQSVVQVEQKAKLGLETTFNLRRQEFDRDRPGYENYYFNSLKLRGIYDLTDRLRLGLFYSHNELFAGFLYPLESFYRPPSSDEFAVAHWGIGCSYEFSGKVVGGIEYHFRDFSQPHPYSTDHGFKHESVNLGLEAKVWEAWSVRGGYIRAGSNVNPVRDGSGRYKSWEDVLTLGSGYQPYGSNLIIELSYRYAFKEFEPWFRDWETEAERQALSLSFKMTL